MTTIRNKNEQFGDSVEFSAETVELAVAEMQSTIRECGACFADVVVSDSDYEVVNDDEATPIKMRINMLAGVSVETLDGNGTWVAAEPGASTFPTRGEAQAYIEQWMVAQDVEQEPDVQW